METARALGAYYTPARLAEPLCRWAVREATDSVLDPSCGEGAFLVQAVDQLLRLGAPPRRLSDQIAGVELDPRALGRARGSLLSRHPGLRWGRLAQDDFFRFADENLGKVAFDAVVGNPPFLRTQGRSAASKGRALRVALRSGARLTADASAWAPFVAAACGLLRPGGRLGMIVPREALFVNYTKPLLEALKARFASVHLVALDGHWFEGALVKVALLLGEGVGPGAIRLHEARTLDRIGDLVEAAPAPVSAASWVWDRIPAECRPAAAAALEPGRTAALSDVAKVLVGVVTGEKDYFLLPQARARALGLPRDLLVPALSRPSQLGGTTFTHGDLSALERSGEACRLLALPPDAAPGEGPLADYLAEGVSRGVDRNYKCRTRKPWYSVRRQLPPPHAFLGYLVKWRPRWAANVAEVHSTNNLHRLYFESPWDQVAEVIAASALSAVTMLSVELLGRIAAGGVLKIEPGDATRVRIVPPGRLLKVRRARERAAAVDRALREGRDWDAYAMADELTREAAGLGVKEVALLRKAQLALRDGRLGRKAE